MSPIQQLLSDNLKAIRKEKKISQQYIADRSDMLASTYNRIENMKVSPSIETIERIANAIDIPLAELFQSREISDKSVTQKLEMINNLSDYNKSVVEILLDSIIEKDKLEKTQEVKMKKRLADLDKARKK
ncbi:helix-turn-helix domain-containing protein [Psychroserpens algicola]|uniref:Helix-turn-helix transcriptional regulator n=1 Tax=Psychroserpens algicola TaxID=1719034 RepID=A0ABT0H5K3_9FLAO|nr:helix-turn-helix transcriptional regulator [Psychroserpens algicola]MCK8479077.1 helix-turn-helix transcriptional regulator [Psychroserpens algicola]